MGYCAIGIIGAGYIGRRHVRALLSMPEVKVAAIADVRLERAAELARHCGAAAYGSYRDMLANERLDAVYICVPPFARGDPEKAVIDCKLPFFVEKPLALDFKTAAIIAAEASRFNLITAVGYHWRYLDATKKAQELLANKDVLFVLGCWFDQSPPAEWWARQELSGGQMVEQTTHTFDLSRLLVGEVTKVYAAGTRIPHCTSPDRDIFDVSTSILHFASGALGSFSSTCVLRSQYRVELQLICEGMVVELSRQKVSVHAGGEAVQVFQYKTDSIEEQDRAFIDAVKGKRNRIRVPYEEALKTHLLVTTVALSAKEERPIEVRSSN